MNKIAAIAAMKSESIKAHIALRVFPLEEYSFNESYALKNTGIAIAAAITKIEYPDKDILPSSIRTKNVITVIRHIISASVLIRVTRLLPEASAALAVFSLLSISELLSLLILSPDHIIVKSGFLMTTGFQASSDVFTLTYYNGKVT